MCVGIKSKGLAVMPMGLVTKPAMVWGREIKSKGEGSCQQKVIFLTKTTKQR